MLLAVAFPQLCTATDFFVDSATGDNTVLTPTEAQPWQTLAKINAAIDSGTIGTGDRIFLKRGSVWNMQTLDLANTNGVNGITVDSYGNPDEPLPVIDGSAYLSDWSIYRASPDQQAGLPFLSNWETGDLMDGGSWVQNIGDAGMLSLSASADSDIDSRFGVISGSQSLRVEKHAATEAYLETADVALPNEFYLRFTFRHIGRQTSDNAADGSGYSVMKLVNGAGAPIVDIGFLGGEGHTMYFRCQVPKDTGGTQWSGRQNLYARPTFDGRPHIIEFHYVPGGASQLSFDGRYGNTDLDRFISGCSEPVAKVRVGIMNGVGQGVALATPGNDVYWIDDLAIAPSTTGWLGSPATIYQTTSPITGLSATSSRRWGQIWEQASGENLNNADRRKAGDIANVALHVTDVNYLLPGEFDLSAEGTIYVAPRSGIAPNDDDYIYTAQRRGINISGSDITVRNIRLQYLWEYGIFVNPGSSGITLEDNQVSHIARIGMRIQGPGNTINVRNNQVWEVGGLWGSDGAGFGLHFGTTNRATPLTNVTVADNTLWDIGASVDADCCGYSASNGWGIEVDEDTSGLIERNRVYLRSGSRLWWEVLRHASGDGLHFENFDHSGTLNDLVVRNNVIVDRPIGMSFNKFNTSASVYNNTVVLPRRGYNESYAFRFGSDPLSSNGGTQGDLMQIFLRNNLVSMRPDDVPGLPDSRLVMNVLQKDVDNGVFDTDYNLAYHPASQYSVTVGTTSWTHTGYLDWLAWSVVANGEANSIAPTVNPLLATTDFTLGTTSPALDEGEYVGQAFGGSAPDIGYFEGEAVDVDDHDMEALDTSAWTTTGATITKSQTTVRSGEHSLRIESAFLNQGSRAKTQAINVTPGDIYRVEGWAYATSSQFANAIVVRDLSHDQYLVDPFSGASNTVSAVNKWQRLEATFTVPAGATAIQVWLMNRNQNQPSYFDDIKLVRMSADGDGDGVVSQEDNCPLLNNPDQEDLDGDGQGDACDEDADGDGTTATTDCNDLDVTVYPGASEVVLDGTDQDCNGYDLTISVVEARFITKGKDKNRLQVQASSALGQAAQLSLAGWYAMSWDETLQRWKILTGRTTKPATVTVSGLEGTVTAPVQ